MLIVNQDKTATSSNMDLSFKSDGVVGYKVINKDIKLGKYKTERRCKEVISEIIQAYENWENLLAGQPQGQCNPVFYMPKY